MPRNTSSTNASPGERDRQRYRYIRYLAEMRGLTVRELHRRHTARACAPCHYSVFYRVAQGRRTSRRIQHWIARALRVPYRELWS